MEDLCQPRYPYNIYSNLINPYHLVTSLTPSRGMGNGLPFQSDFKDPHSVSSHRSMPMSSTWPPWTHSRFQHISFCFLAKPKKPLPWARQLPSPNNRHTWPQAAVLQVMKITYIDFKSSSGGAGWGLCRHKLHIWFTRSVWQPPLLLDSAQTQVVTSWHVDRQLKIWK